MATTRSASGAKRATKPRATATADAAPRKRARSAASISVSAEERQRMIREAAYFRAAQRGFTPGDEMADWLAAEAEVNILLEK